MFEVRLRPGLPGGRWACLREIRGRDEAVATGSPELVAVELIDRLLLDVPSTSVRPGTAADLAICDRDRILAAIYLEHFGPRIEGTRRCRGCNEAYEVGFALPDLLATMEAEAAASTRCTGPDEDGAFALPNGRRFRLPTTRGRRAVLGLEPTVARRKLLEACLLDGAPATDAEVIEPAMEEVGPMLAQELDAACPSCGAAEPVHFDIIAHLAGVLAAERRFLNREVHCLARAYGWGLEEILGLPRSDRRAFVRLNERRSDEAWG